MLSADDDINAELAANELSVTHWEKWKPVEARLVEQAVHGAHSTQPVRTVHQFAVGEPHASGCSSSAARIVVQQQQAAT